MVFSFGDKRLIYLDDKSPPLAVVPSYNTSNLSRMMPQPPATDRSKSLQVMVHNPTSAKGIMNAIVQDFSCGNGKAYIEVLFLSCGV